MAKRKSKPQPPDVVRWGRRNDGSKPAYVRDRFTNSKGTEVVFLPVKQGEIADLHQNIEQQMIEAKEPLKPPTYEFEIAGGGKKTEEHDEESIKTADEETKKKWERYLEAKEKLNNSLLEATLRLLILEGVANQPDERWIKRQKLIGLTLPDDPDELKLRYGVKELFTTQEEISQMLFVIPPALGNQGLDEEAYLKHENKFRNSVAQNAGQPASTDKAT